MFFEDAKVASKELDLILTGKNAGVEERVPMCGIPYHAASGYLQRLVSRGYKVAIVEQVEDPKKAVGLVKRDVIRIVTPGTIMDEINDEKSSVYFASIVDYGYGYALAVCEASTGENFIEHINHKDTTLMQTILKNNVREVVVHTGFRDKIIQSLREMHIVISYCDDSTIDEKYKPLIDTLSRSDDLEAYGLMLQYLENTQRHALDHLQPVENEDDHMYLSMDYSTVSNLELVKPLHPEQGNSTTLWSFLDTCKSAMGSRELKKWVEKPLLNEEKINKRYDRVQYLMKHFMARKKVRDSLNTMYDLPRLIARCAMRHANAIDCSRLIRTLEEVPSIFKELNTEEFSYIQNVDMCQSLYTVLKDAFVEDPPLLTSQGGMFKDGYNQELDEAREIQRNGQAFYCVY